MRTEGSPAVITPTGPASPRPRVQVSADLLDQPGGRTPDKAGATAAAVTAVTADDDRLLHPDAADRGAAGRHRAASPGFLVIAAGCTLMMALMMRGMGQLVVVSD